MKAFYILFTTLVCGLLLTGCMQDQSQLGYIGSEGAKIYALAAAGVTTDLVDTIKTDLESRDGVYYYEVTFTSGGGSYRYDIDAMTGRVLESTTPDTLDSVAQETAPATDAPAPSDSLVTDADTYEQISTPPSAQPTQNTQSSSGTMISVDRAKELAIAHAGLSSDQVSFIKGELDRDDGYTVYDIEFYSTDYTEYDYEVDAYTGDIVSFDYDIENYTPPTSGSNKEITAEEAKNIAISQVPGSTTSDIYEFEVDYDDGRLEYEGKIYYGNMEYEFEIDGYSGAIRSWEAESIHR